MLQLDVGELARLASITSWEQEQAIRAGRLCADCGAPICAGIAALHRHCPAKEGVTPMRSATRRKRRKAA